MEYVLVSACLLGQAVRYDGGDMRCEDDILQRWVNEGRVLSICPEVAGGLPVPRPRAEIAGAAGGANVLAGVAKVFDTGGREVTAHLVSGADRALELAQARNVRIAILKEGSPSCGSGYTFDGSFSNIAVPASGVTATRLQQAGVHVFSENRLTEAAALLKAIEAGEVV